jgi:hypothetical protein
LYLAKMRDGLGGHMGEVAGHPFNTCMWNGAVIPPNGKRKVSARTAYDHNFSFMYLGMSMKEGAAPKFGMCLEFRRHKRGEMIIGWEEKPHHRNNGRRFVSLPR